MSDVIVTEYRELAKNSQLKLLNEQLEVPSSNSDDLVITFIEDPELEDDFELDLVDESSFLEPPTPEDISEYFESDTDELIDFEDHEAMHFQLPGAPDYVDDDLAEEEEEEEEVETDWENDRDPKHFMAYILKMYPGQIPKHNGKSTLGCEKAVLFLTNLNKEISEALRSEHEEGELDLDVLEDIRVRMTKDVVKLKEHIKKLNKDNKKTKKKAEVELEPVIVKQNSITNEIIKEASTPKVQLVMTPFQRAITGIILNSTISAGKPFESVYEFLKKKYKFTDREELEILQLLMDMGQPIFKDRGIIGDEGQDEEGHGIDFIKTYFA